MESILKSEFEEKLLALCEHHLEPVGFRIVDVEGQLSSKSHLRVFIEPLGARNEKKSTSLDDCVRATQVLSPVLEALDWIPGAYDLEISSPGLDRRLRLRSDFEQVVGKKAKLRLTESLPGKGANLTGVIGEAAESGVDLLLGESKRTETVRVPWQKIKRAQLVWQP